MKKIIITIILLLIFIPFVIIGFSFLRNGGDPVPEDPPDTPNVFPPLNGGGTTPPPNTQTPDMVAILERPETQSFDEGVYRLDEEQGVDASYSLVYYAPDKSFTISLRTKPLGAARAAAEAELISILGIEKSAICNLEVTVGTPISVDSVYSGRDLGLSFCPGSVALP